MGDRTEPMNASKLRRRSREIQERRAELKYPEGIGRTGSVTANSGDGIQQSSGDYAQMQARRLCRERVSFPLQKGTKMDERRIVYAQISIHWC